ncbi:hypothetical protein K488DRAFT_83396 [Vararia minispora EC-137]|uniref:Uncharacterized protein n=1 Tax=Vararia minispora EC-137 TaxID=1314806 RepID=A0ACB8QU78_9AGAM|nr:hypothetical protein K488DRAFT_83396 [Vararia minispora EC-137]
MVACRECGHAVFQDEEDGPVCTNCGTLLDPAHTRLVNVEGQVTREFRDQHEVPDYTPYVTTLKSLRNDGRDLSGQSTQGRNERNMAAIKQTIEALARRLGRPGSAARAKHLFCIAHEQAKLRWGRASTAAAGSALILAIREDNGSDPAQDLAYLLSVPTKDLNSMLMRLLPVWGLHLPPITAISELPAIFSHLTTIISPANPGAEQSMPADVLSFVRALLPDATHSLRQTAEGIYEILARPSGEQATQRYSILTKTPSPVAGACVLLALEAHAQRPTPHIGELANAMATRTRVSGKTICDRYRSISDELACRAALVPWLRNESTAVGRVRKPRDGAKRAEGRRAMLARQILDTVAYYQSAWKTRLESDGPVDVVFEGGDTDHVNENSPWALRKAFADGDGSAGLSPEVSATDDIGENLLPHSPSSGATPEEADIPAKRDLNVSTTSIIERGRKRRAEDTLLSVRKTKRKQASRVDHLRAEDFLLNPFIEQTVPDAATHKYAPSIDLTSHLLAPNTTIGRGSRDPPTRLQVLASARGGESAIGDDELFAEGELEGLVLSPTEAAAREPLITALFGPDWGVQTERRRRLTKQEKVARRGLGRMDAKALARVLGRTDVDEDELTRGLVGEIGLELLDVDEDESEDEYGEREGTLSGLSGGDEDVDVLPWRELSAEASGYEGRYDF